MDESVLTTYLATVDPERAPTVVELDRIVLATCPEINTKISYGQLAYTLGDRWSEWICAIDAKPKGSIAFRFLYGVLLDDPRGVLRCGTGPLCSIDIPDGSAVDTALVADYLRDAVAKFDRFKAGDHLRGRN